MHASSREKTNAADFLYLQPAAAAFIAGVRIFSLQIRHGSMTGTHSLQPFPF